MKHKIIPISIPLRIIKVAKYKANVEKKLI